MNKYYEIKSKVLTPNSYTKKYTVKINIKYFDKDFKDRIYYLDKDSLIILKSTILSLLLGDQFKKVKRLIFQKKNKTRINLLKTSKFQFDSIKDAENFKLSITNQLSKVLNKEIGYHVKI